MISIRYNMKFKILGSGGCVSLPRPLCMCEVCEEAREKGVPYSRFGSSLYLEDLNLLIDTPEDIRHALNYFKISAIDNVCFSHMDPDHTLGMRLFEDLRLNWFDVGIGKECDTPINVYAMEHVMEDLKLIQTKHGSFFDYYENVRNLIKTTIVEQPLRIKGIKITFIKAGHSTIFIFEANGKKLIYAPCDIKPFPKNELFQAADVLIIGDTIVAETVKNGRVLSQENTLREVLFSMDEIVDLTNTYQIKNTIITHIEEDWGKSYDEYKLIAEAYDNISFAYDGLEIIL